MPFQNYISLTPMPAGLNHSIFGASSPGVWHTWSAVPGGWLLSGPPLVSWSQILPMRWKQRSAGFPRRPGLAGRESLIPWSWPGSSLFCWRKSSVKPGRGSRAGRKRNGPVRKEKGERYEEKQGEIPAAGGPFVIGNFYLAGDGGKGEDRWYLFHDCR